MNNTKQQELAVDFLYKSLQASETKEDFLLVFWIYWVESVTTTGREFQKVIANAAVNCWFIKQLSKHEAEFSYMISNYPDTSGKDKDWLYIKCISSLMSYFPQALLESAKKRDIKPQRTKVSGKQIEFLIFNQN